MKSPADRCVRVKRNVINLLLCAGILVGLFMGCLHAIGPPKEAKLIRNFHAHQASFELLRDMLESDTQIRRLADWGVETDKGMAPPGGNFPIDRFNKYLALLKEVGAKGVARGEGNHADPSVLVWASGFAGDTVHILICWQDETPSRQAASLDDYIHHPGTEGGHGWVYRHIEGNWYLATDIASQ